MNRILLIKILLKEILKVYNLKNPPASYLNRLKYIKNRELME